MAALAQKYAQAEELKRNLKELQNTIDHWWAMFVDLHPFTSKNVYGAKLDDFDKDIFVDTAILSRRPQGPHTRISVRTVVNNDHDEQGSQEQVRYTNPPFYVVSRHWYDGGNPILTIVEEVTIIICTTPSLSLSVNFRLEDGRAREVTMREFGGVILVHPQQGEVAELVMSLAEGNMFPDLGPLETRRLRYERLEDGQRRCARLFCTCNQFVNADMTEFVRCASSGQDSNKMYQEMWHYSMPRNFALWDSEQLVESFRFQTLVAKLANDHSLVLQPQCDWVQDFEGKIKVAEDTCLLIGWQRQSPPDPNQAREQTPDVVGYLLPSSIMDVTTSNTDTVETVLQGILSSGKVDVVKHHVSSSEKVKAQVAAYLRGPGAIEPDHSPTRLWDVETGKVIENIPRGTRYCAVSYVWSQWYKINSTKVDTERLRSCLKKLTEDTGTGIKFFWVDSVCIDQKCDKDKSREIPNMARYYGEAAFTVALLPDVTEPQATPTPIPWQVIDIKAHYKSNKRLIGQYARCKWLSRIWTMQEAWLAKKLLIKTDKELIRGDYLELLRTSRTIVKQYGSVPVCLEWMNIGPSLVLGACTGNILVPGEIPSLLTRPAGSLLHNNNGMGLQPRTTTLLRALRLSNGRNATVQADRLVGLLGMVEQGHNLAKKIRLKMDEDEGRLSLSSLPSLRGKTHSQYIDPEDVFELAAQQRMLGPEIMLCKGRLDKLSWLPNLRDDPKSVELPHTTSLVAGGILEVSREGASIRALKGELVRIKTLPRGTVMTGESAWKYSCTFVSASSGREWTAKVASIEQVKKDRRDVLLLQRSGKQGPFIAVRGQPRNGNYYYRKQGFLLTLDDDPPLEGHSEEIFRSYIIGKGSN